MIRVVRPAAEQQPMMEGAEVGEIACATIQSPLGPLLAAATPRGLLRLSFADEPLDRVLSELSTRTSWQVVERPTQLDDASRQLQQYFAGERRAFDLPLDWALVRAGFGRRVLEEVSRVPFGELITYGDLAARAGNPNAYRAAGNALGANPLPVVIPCHRVVHAGGGPGGYGAGLDRKRLLLRLEGCPLSS